MKAFALWLSSTSSFTMHKAAAESCQNQFTSNQFQSKQIMTDTKHV